ncbi:MAG: NgoMIV family type II restriction endonuclease [Novosphingobium sp.]|nr:NgoMIV family type II restriction endonuclease [Novosphingobium sp.]
MPDSLITRARREFHASLLSGILTRNKSGCPSNADKDSKVSINIANGILDRLGPASTSEKLPGQTAGADFEGICAAFVRETYSKLAHLRPGRFFVEKGGSIARFDQYAHLSELAAMARRDRTLATAIGRDYLIKPDVVVYRLPEADETLNAGQTLVDDVTARLASIRLANQSQAILHASLSCKWTLRSDRAQNARSEGLNLVRNRKGRLPHIAVITGEPLPTRIASLALGTGDIDCVYHFALDELRATLSEPGSEDRLELLETMISGKRLRDIADLPLDLIT